MSEFPFRASSQLSNYSCLWSTVHSSTCRSARGGKLPWTIPESELDLAPNGRAIATQLAGNVWKVPVKPGDLVSAGDALVIVESRKMEFPVAAPCAGKVLQVFCQEGSQVAAGQNLIVLETALSPR